MAAPALVSSAPPARPVRVAVVGCGAAGLSAAWQASRDARVSVTLLEARAALGGHANTVRVRGEPVDTGFLVFNENSYPNLLGLFAELGVATEPSDMSFAVSLARRAQEWGSDGLRALFATPSNLLSSDFRAMLRDLLRFNAAAPAFLARVRAEGAGGPAARTTMAQFLDEGAYGARFRDWYLVPQMAAVWSASAGEVLAFPAATFIQFCVNHSLVQLVDRPVWRTVSRRSAEYVRRLVASLPPDRTTIRLGARIARVSRFAAGAPGGAGAGGGDVVLVTDDRGRVEEFDHVIFGCHPDEALALLADSGAEERAALGAFVYSQNAAFLHTDARLMPSRRACWASWNYIGKGEEGAGAGAGEGAGAGAGDGASAGEPCCVTYWLNRLQSLPPRTPGLFLTLNPAPAMAPPPEALLARFSYAHPQYTLGTVAAQGALDALQGARNTWFCGAYLGFGFHEDAVTSGLRIAARITGTQPPWWASRPRRASR